MLFDYPGRPANTPKYFEHQWQDAATTVSLGHCCDKVIASAKIPSQKRTENFLIAVSVKRSLARFVSTYFHDDIST